MGSLVGSFCARLPSSISRDVKRHFGLILAVVWTAGGMVAAATPTTIRVTLTDGSRLQAQHIEPADDSRYLQLRIETEQIRLSRRIRWQELRSARIDGKQWTRAELAESLLGQESVRGEETNETASHSSARQATSAVQNAPGKSRCPPRHRHRETKLDARVLGVRRDPLSAYRSVVKKAFPDGVPLSEVGFALHLARARTAQKVLAPRPRWFGGPRRFRRRRRPVPPPDGKENAIQRIAAAARPVSSHGRLDWDTLRLHLRALNRRDQSVSAEGTLRVILWGSAQRLLRVHRSRFLAHPEQVKKLATWTRRVKTDNSGHKGIRVDLPLPRPLPEHDTKVAPVGELHVRLLVPGQGVFETTRSHIPLRQASGLRNRQFLETGSRFFAEEGTVDSRRRQGLNPEELSPLRPNGRVFTVEP